MKLQNFNLRKLILSVAVLLTTGCSINTIGAIASPSAFTPMVGSLATHSLSKGRIAFTYWDEKKYNIYVMNIDGDGLKNLTDNLPYSVVPTWSPDGKYIAFTSSAGIDQIYRINANGSDLRQLTFDKAHSSGPVWSPDGKYIVFISERNGILSDRGVPIPIAYIMNSDGSDQRQLTNNQDFVNAVSWYPKGDFISVTVAGLGRYSLVTYLINWDGVIQKQSFEFVANEIPHWSPNGEFVLFSTIGRSECSGIVVMKADGTNQNCLIIDKILPPVSAGAASWSPDGKYIIFSSNLDGDYDLYIVKVDGSDLIQLTNMPGDETSPTWSAVP